MSDRTVKYTFTASILGLTAGLTAAGRNVAELGTKLTAADAKGARMRAGLTQLGGVAGKVGLVAAAGFAVAVAAAAKFDQSMSNVQAATHETAGNMDLLRQAAIDAGAATKFSATEAAEGIEALAKAGVSTADILGGALDDSLNLAAAGSLDVAQAAEIAATTMTQFGLAGSDVGHIADLLAAAAGKAQGEVSDMAAALKYVGPVAAQMGVSLDETTGTIAELASQGIIGEQAGTSLRGMLTSLTSPSKLAADEMQNLGISLYDAQGNFVGLDGIAGQLKESMSGLSAAERDQALGRIFGNEQITAARILYSGGAEAVQQWTSAVNDQGYAADTAAIKMDNLAGDLEQLKGSLETAFIGAGGGSQGPLRSLTQGLTDAVNVFNKLPHSAQNTTTALLGITAITGGGLWFGAKVIGGISDAKKAIQDLGIESTRVKGALKGLGIAAGVGTALMITSAAIEEIESHSMRAVPGVEALTKSLIGLGDAQAAQHLQDQLGDINEAMAALDDPGFWGKLDKFADGVPLGLGNLSHWASPAISLGISNADQAADEATASLTALDEALANVVVTGSADTARQTFDDLAAAYGLTDEQQKTLTSHLPQYQEALDGAANSAVLAGGATEGFGTSARKAALTADDAMGKLQTRFEKVRDAARETAKGFINLGDSLNNPKKSLGEWLHSLEKQAEALRNFRINAQDAAKKGLDEGLIKSLEKAGPEGALRMKQLANATDAEIKRANKAWRSGQDEIDKYARSIAGIPPEAKTNVIAKTFDAMTAIAKLKVALSNIRDKDVDVRIHYLSIGNKLAGMAAVGAAGADGMTVPGARSPYGDKVLAYIAPGEEVISNRHGQADRHRDLLKSISANRFADGGTAGLRTYARTSQGTNSLPASADAAANSLFNLAGLGKRELEIRSRLLNKEVERDQKAADAARDHRNAVLDDMKSLKDSIASRFKSDLFGQDLGFGAESGISSAALAQMQASLAVNTLRSDIAEAREARRLYAQLRKAGLHGAALTYAQQNASNGELSALLGDPKTARQYQRLYGTRQQVSGQAGSTAAFQRYGDELAGARHELSAALAVQKDMKAELKAVNHRLEQIRAENKHNSDDNAKKTTDGLNHTAGQAARRR